MANVNKVAAEEAEAHVSRKEKKKQAQTAKKEKEMKRRYGEFIDMAKELEQREAEKEALNPKEKKTTVILHALNPHYLKMRIKTYGYEYNLGSFMLQLIVVLAAVIGLSVYFELAWWTTIITIVASLACAPFVLISQYEHLYNSNKYDQLVQYLEYMIYTFKVHPKILTSLKETSGLTTGEIQKYVDEAIHYIENETESPDVFENALGIIERHYPSSRVVALHRAMITVEEKSSIDYQDSIDNLYFDVRAWSTRTYKYMTDLKMKKFNMTISIVVSMLILAIFTQIYKGNPQLSGFTSGIVYQVLTCILLIMMVLTFTVTNTKLNGEWLVDDTSDIGDLNALAAYNAIKHWDPDSRRKNGIVLGAMVLVIAAVMSLLLVNMRKFLIIGGFAFFLFMFFWPKIDYKKKLKTVERSINKEFPIWLRDIALQLNSTVVVNAIHDSYAHSSVVMRPFIEQLLNDINDDPTSINPYNNFMKEFNIPEIQISMKTLYSIQSVGQEDATRQVSDLIVRNQAMLDHAEKIRNDDSIAVVQFMTNVPMLLMAVKMMGDMLLMMSSVMASMGSAQ